ncbi:hypothetical protein EJ110_NYTH27787 [Nymphaea thermarum]|nr:hypothetical protein EJ110_NYTH27787 [Nymphaea thermarum]
MTEKSEGQKGSRQKATREEGGEKEEGREEKKRQREVGRAYQSSTAAALRPLAHALSLSPSTACFFFAWSSLATREATKGESKRRTMENSPRRALTQVSCGSGTGPAPTRPAIKTGVTQPLILCKKTARDMWIILEQMYGQKKRKVCVYQLMKDLYALRQGDLSVADFYAALKSKWEDLDYHFDDIWSCPQDQMHYMTKEWENRIFLFLAGLNDEFENIRSQILNYEESFSIEDVYSRVDAEEQRQLINGRKGNHMSHNEWSAFVSCTSMGTACSSRKCTHCKKLGYTMEFCWDLHPEKKNSRGRSSGRKKPGSNAMNPSDDKVSISVEQIRELQAYFSQIDVGQADTSDEVKRRRRRQRWCRAAARTVVPAAVLR